jgi:hypothetical protein
MRVPKYLSPTSISIWIKNREEFYLKYLADNRPPRMLQTQPMSIGASFDAYIKSYLYKRLFGKSHDPKFDFQNLFEAQVEPHNRDWALKHGKFLFNFYKESGAVADLMDQLLDAESDPNFEIQIEGHVSYSGVVTKWEENPVVLLGKPDIQFINKLGAFIIYDWKVNGYCSVSLTSPKKGYIKTYGMKASGPHKDAVLYEADGIIINVAHPMNVIDTAWADQLCIYSWIMGANVGSKFTVGIDQLCGKGGVDNRFPDIRIASFRNRIDKQYQEDLFTEITDIWDRVHAGPEAIFDTPDSANRAAVLDKHYLAYQDTEDIPQSWSEWFKNETRQHRNY